VLVVAVGKATKLLRFVEKTRKGYVGRGRARDETSTLDAAGDVSARFDMSR
jgi:tRNA pseudouridine55 synthase